MEQEVITTDTPQLRCNRPRPSIRNKEQPFANEGVLFNTYCVLRDLSHEIWRISKGFDHSRIGLLA